jgi:hypothetical protein
MNDKYIERSKLEMTAKKAEIDLLLFDLLNDCPIAWLAFFRCFEKMTPKQRSDLKDRL